MSWLDKVQNNIVITCGDGNSFSPQYVNATKEKEYKITEFEFPNIEGALVKRRAPGAHRYNLELIFQGENNIEDAEAFEASADDPRPWNITHPYYGDILVQPTNLNQSNTDHNVTRVNCEVIETIEEVYPDTSVSQSDVIQDSANETELQLAESFAENSDITPADDGGLSKTADQAFNSSVNNTPSDFANEYRNAFNTATSEIDNAVSEPLAAMRSTQNLLTLPSQFETTVKTRINLLKGQFDKLVSTIGNITGLNAKEQFQASAGTTLSAMSRSVVGNYETRNDVLNVIDTINEAKDTFFESIDELQDDDFLPNADALRNLSNTVNAGIVYALIELREAKQERKVVLVKNENLITLTHKLIGLDQNDENIQRLADINELSFSEFIQIKAGREITYYV